MWLRVIGCITSRHWGKSCGRSIRCISSTSTSGEGEKKGERTVSNF